MKDIGIIQGSFAQAQPLIIGVDTVYIHTDIVKIETDSMGKSVDNLYQYNEIQCTKDEYIEIQGKTLEKQKADIDFIAVITGVDLDV